MTDSKTSFTPGPWQSSSYEGGWNCVRDSHEAEICRLVQNNPANARLIAAAPDLYAALEHIAAITSDYEPGQRMSAADTETVLHIARHGLAKARPS